MSDVLKVFLGSPGDVAAARSRVHAVVDALNEDPLVQPRVEVVDWQRTPHTRNAWLPPQKVIAQGIARPSACGVAVFVFHARIGTALIADAVDEDLRAALGFDPERIPLTGSVWELCDAFTGARDGAAVVPLVFHCQREYPRAAGDRAARQESRRQQDAVEDLLDAFRDEQRRFRHTCIDYDTEDAFAAELNRQLRSIINERSRGAPRHREVGEQASAAVPTPPAAYLDALARDLTRISLLGLDPKRENRARLDSVYTPAMTPAPAGDSEPANARPQGPRQRGEPSERLARLMDRVAQQSLYVPGAPGSGKSVFCRWLCLAVARGELPAHPVPAPQEYQDVFPQPLAGMLPVRVPLRDFYPRVEWRADVRDWSVSDLELELAQWLDAVHPRAFAGGGLRDFLARGRVLLVLDGFDEVPASRAVPGGGSAHPRDAIRSGLERAIPHWHARGHRVLLTSRPYGLTATEAARLGLDEAPLADLAQPLQELFIRRWFQAVEPDRAQELAQELLARLHAPGTPALDHVLRNPMMLTALCVGYQVGQRLPRDVDELYDAVVSFVLHSRYGPDLRDVDTARRRLCVIAQAMQCGRFVGEQESAPGDDLDDEPHPEIGFAQIDGVLRDYAGSQIMVEGHEAGELAARDKREDLLSRSGLLLPAGDERAQFYHLDLQDHLAAERLYRNDADLPAWLARYAGTARWQQTLRFWFARIARDRTVLRALRAVQDLEPALAPVRLNENPWPGLLYADCLDLARQREGVPAELAARFHDACLEALGTVASPSVRQRLFDVLGNLGCDDRPGVGLDADGLPDIDWVDVAAGMVVLEDEQGTHRVGAFRLARYPVTWAQFEAFVHAEDGYRSSAWWQGCPDDERRPSTRTAHVPVANHPRETVSWWEACAFCRWLAKRRGLPIRLPSEEEWQLAATGGDAARVYPWGADYRDGLAHCKDGLQSPRAAAPVGLYSGGDSVDGIKDLAGNVWEWMATEVADDHPPVREEGGPCRVLRGGSWDGEPADGRSADRRGVDSGTRLIDVGFRLAQDIR